MSYGAIGTAHMGGTGGSHDKFVPEKWSKEVQIAVEDNLVAAKCVRDMSGMVKDGGDTFRIPIISNMPAAVSRSATTFTALTVDATTEDYKTLSINKRYVASFIIDDMLKWQTVYQIADLQKDKAIYSLASQIDDDVLAQGGSFTNVAVGTLGQDPGIDEFVLAIKALDQANAPTPDRHFIMGPATLAAYRRLSQFISGDFVTDKPVTNGRLGDRYGVDLRWTNNIPKDASNNEKNQMFHRDASVLAIQNDINLESQRLLEYTGTLHVGQVLYGVLSDYRPTFGVLVYGKG